MKDIKRYFTMNGSPRDVYNAITNKKMLEIWTGEPAEMEVTVGSSFSLWSGSISGINLELVENELIVQHWFFDEDSENSIVTMKLHSHKKGCSVELHHTNIPDEAYENISDGWDQDYFGAINELFI